MIELRLKPIYFEIDLFSMADMWPPGVSRIRPRSGPELSSNTSTVHSTSRECAGHIWCRVQLRSNTYEYRLGPRDRLRARSAQNHQNHPFQDENYQNGPFQDLIPIQLNVELGSNSYRSRAGHQRTSDLVAALIVILVVFVTTSVGNWLKG